MASLSLEFCAFTVAIVIECRPNNGSSQQHSVESIIHDFKQFEHCEDHNFHVNIDALHQGLAIFKKPIERLGHKIIFMSAHADQFRTKEFMDISPRTRGSELVYTVVENNLIRKRDDFVTDIAKTANVLLHRTFQETSKYVSISEILGVLWLLNLSDSSDSNKRRKVGEDLGDKQLLRYGNQVREFVSTHICTKNESPFVYINAAVKLSISKSESNLDAVRRNIFDDESDDEEDMAKILSHPSVIDGLTEFPKRYIKFHSYEIEKIITLFDVIETARAEIEGTEYKKDDSLTANFTKRALKKYTHYSELKIPSIVRWSNSRDNVKKEVGRKISIEFEADVWGKLMICEFEKTNVSFIKFKKHNIKFI